MTPDGVAARTVTPAQRRLRLARRALAARGMLEAVTWSFMDASHADLFGGATPQTTLENPITTDLDVMRPSILPNLIQAARWNADRSSPDVALFEIGPQFAGNEPEDQATVAAGLRAGNRDERQWYDAPRAVDAFDAKADALAALDAAGAPVAGLQVAAEAPGWYHPGRSGVLKLGNRVLAAFGELHPRALRALDTKGPMVGFEVFFDRLPPHKDPRRNRGTKARPLLNPSPFQPVERDFAFVLDRDTPAAKVARAAKNAEKTLVSDVSVFDVYEGTGIGEGRKSVAIAVTLQPTEKTLTDAEIEAVAEKIVAAVAKQAGRRTTRLARISHRGRPAARHCKVRAGRSGRRTGAYSAATAATRCNRARWVDRVDAAPFATSERCRPPANPPRRPAPSAGRWPVGSLAKEWRKHRWPTKFPYSTIINLKENVRGFVGGAPVTPCQKV